VVSPNFELFLWILLIVIFVRRLFNIGLDLLEAKKSSKYGAADMLDGIFWMIVIIIVVLL